MNATSGGVRRRTVALIGRANAGKTSVLMHLSGSLQRPVNFPGTSVERAECTTRHGDCELLLVDLPGIGSLRAVSRDEQVTVDYLTGAAGNPPDLLCVVVDVTRLPVDLRFLQEVRRLGVPIVVALTKVDVAAAEGAPVDVERLVRALGVPAVALDGRRGTGSDDLRALLASDRALQPPPPPPAADATTDVVKAVQGRPLRAGAGRTDRIDGLLLHPLVGPLVLLLLLVFAFQLVFAVAEPFMAVIEAGQGLLTGWIEAIAPEGAVRSLIVDGIVNGLGTVLVFVPQIALLMAFVAVLESSGYMARAVFLLDRLLRRIGLTGKSFVPLSSSFACAIPGILAARILDDERDRIATIVVSPLMSCSARLPVYVVLLAAFFPAAQAGLLLFLLYLLGIVAAAIVALLLRRTLLRGGVSMLAMEMPAYHRPRVRFVLRQALLSVREFLRTAGTVILLATVGVWALAYFPRPAEIHARFEAQRATVPVDAVEQRARLDAMEAEAYLEQSLIARMGRGLQPVFAPAGFDWRLTVGILAAFPARELVIPTLGTLHSLGDVEADDDPDSESVARLRTALREAKGVDGRPTMNGLVALAAMAFFALCSQCASTLAAIRRETHSWFWPAFTFAYMTGLAWLVAVAIYQVGSLLGYGVR